MKNIKIIVLVVFAIFAIIFIVTVSFTVFMHYISIPLVEYFGKNKVVDLASQLASSGLTICIILWIVGFIRKNFKI